MATPTNERATLLILVPSASVGFALAFNLGAFGVVFFDRILAVWVMATIVLVASLVTSLPPNGWLGRIVLLIPSVWLLLAFIDSPDREGSLDDGIFVATIAVTVICLPFIAWILISAINPEFLQLPRSSKTVIVVTVLVFAIAGWALGYRNNTFLTCDDFKISGNDLPASCVQVSESN
jgi:hypothetical protein